MSTNETWQRSYSKTTDREVVGGEPLPSSGTPAASLATPCYPGLNFTRSATRKVLNVPACVCGLKEHQAESVWRQQLCWYQHILRTYVMKVTSKRTSARRLSHFSVWTKACCSWDRMVWETAPRPSTSGLTDDWPKADTPRKDTPTRAAPTLQQSITCPVVDDSNQIIQIAKIPHNTLTTTACCPH